MAADKLPLDPRQDLAGFESLGSRGSFQVWIGGTPVITDAGVAGTAAFPVAKYTLCALMPDNTVVPYVPATHKPEQAVINAQPIEKLGQAVPYWDSGKFNHECINFPAAWNTYLLRKNGLVGSMGLRVGHLI